MVQHYGDFALTDHYTCTITKYFHPIATSVLSIIISGLTFTASDNSLVPRPLPFLLMLHSKPDLRQWRRNVGGGGGGEGEVVGALVSSYAYYQMPDHEMKYVGIQ